MSPPQTETKQTEVPSIFSFVQTQTLSSSPPSFSLSLSRELLACTPYHHKQCALSLSHHASPDHLTFVSASCPLFLFLLFSIIPKPASHFLKITQGPIFLSEIALPLPPSHLRSSTGTGPRMLRTRSSVLFGSCFRGRVLILTRISYLLRMLIRFKFWIFLLFLICLW